MLEPKQMRVAFGFFEGDVLLHRGEFLIGAERTFGVYGEHLHVALPDDVPFSHKPEIQLFSGLTVEHSFELPACPVSMHYYAIATGQSGEHPRQRRALVCDIRMGVHTSKDWEFLDLPVHARLQVHGCALTALMPMPLADVRTGTGLTGEQCDRELVSTR